MAVTVMEDLREGLQMQMAESAGIVNRTLTRAFLFKDLPGLGIAKFLSVWNYLGVTLQGDGGPVTIPRSNERLIMASQVVYAKSFEVVASADADAELRVGYVNTPLSGFDNVVMETGTTYEQDETDWDAENVVKPFNQRTPMYFLYDPQRQGTPNDTPDTRHAVRLPVLTGKSFVRYTKTISKDPRIYSERFCSPPKTNNRPWKGYATETVLALQIVGRNAGQGWSTMFDFAVDKIGHFRQVGRVRDPQTGEPIPLTQQQVSQNNGIKEFTVQPKENFSLLPI
jgi:hypothetical protein